MICLYRKSKILKGFARLKEDFGIADSALAKAF